MNALLAALREPRDVVGEALRRWRYGLIRPHWADMEDDRREIYRIDADNFIIARLAEAGYELVPAPPPDSGDG